MNVKIAVILTLSYAGVFASSVNYDLLGRKGSKMNSPMVYKDIDYAKTKKDKQQLAIHQSRQHLAKVGLTNNVAAIEGIFVPNSANPYYLKTHFINHNSTDEWFSSVNQYMTQSNNVFIPVTYNYTNPTNYTHGGLTNSGVSGYSVSFQNLSFNQGENIQPSPYEYNKSITYAPLSYVKYRSYWIDMNWLYEVPYDGESSNVGVYIESEARPVKLASNDDVSYIQYTPSSEFKTMPGHEMIASKSYKLLKNTSNRSIVYIGTTPPDNPANKSPQVYMGLHTEKCVNGNSSATAIYSASAKNLDNYIYNNRTIEIVAAGNFSTKQNVNKPNGTGYLAAKAHAANAITVGAIHLNNDNAPYLTKNITNYTSYVLPTHGSEKPEIYNYSHIYMNDPKKIYTSNSKTFEYYPFYDGTEMAASYTAGIVSDLLNANSFYRWHPEMVKSVMLTGSYDAIDPPYPHNPPTAKIPSYKSTVFNRYHNSFQHQSRYWIGDFNHIKNTLTYPISADAIGEIRFNVNTLSQKNFKAAISWLNSGDDIAAYGKIPQNFDIFVFGNNTDNVDRFFSPSDLLGHTLDKNVGSSYKTISLSFDRNYQYLTFCIVFWNDETSLPNKNQIVLGFDITSD